MSGKVHHLVEEFQFSFISFIKSSALKSLTSGLASPSSIVEQKAAILVSLSSIFFYDFLQYFTSVLLSL